MLKTTQIWPEEIRRRDGGIVSAAVIESPGRESQRLWYRLPEEREAQLPEHSDHLVVGSAFLIMQLGFDVRVHGLVTPSLIRNLTEFQAAWAQIRQGLKNVEIRADSEREVQPPAGRRGAVVAFSGGVDSCFSAFRHVRGVSVRCPRAVSAGVMVHGFDIPLGEPEAFASAMERSRRMAASLGIGLIPVATNYKDVVQDWSHSHGAAVASCLALLGGGYTEGVIGQTFTYGEIRHITEGVNALTDPLLSSDYFRIVPDGAGFERADKIRVVGEWKEFLQDARVCWQGPQKDRNCCVCEKCVRNILTFRALGLGLPPCFEHDVDEEQIRRLGMGEITRAEIRYGGLAALAAASGASGRWVQIIERRLADERRSRRSRPYRVARRLQRRFSRILARFKPKRNVLPSNR